MGGRQLWRFEPAEVPILDRILTFGTHGRHFGRFGPVASSDLPIWQRPAHFRRQTRIYRPNTPHFELAIDSPLNFMLCSLGVDNFGMCHPILGSETAELASLELTTGPFSEQHPFWVHFRSYRRAMPRFGGDRIPPMENRGRKIKAKGGPLPRI